MPPRAKALKMAQPRLPAELRRDLAPFLTNFVILSEISRGSYGAVFKVALKNSRKRYALKLFFPLMSPQMMEMEIIFNYMFTPWGICPPLSGGLPQLRSNSFMLSEFERSDSFHAKLETMSEDYVRVYLFEMLKGVYALERMGVMHRDLKPSNFLFCYETRQGYITDFGLAEVVLGYDSEYNEGAANNEDSLLERIYEIQVQCGLFNRYGTRGYMAPEVVLNQKTQTTAVDVWAAGVTFLSMLTKHHPNLLPVDREAIRSDKVKDILPFISIFGYQQFVQKAESVYHVKVDLPPYYQKFEAVDFFNLSSPKFTRTFREKGANLLSKMLRFDYRQRYTAGEALADPFFDEVREEQIQQMFE